MEARVNRAFAQDAVAAVPAELFEPGTDLVAAAAELRIVASDLHVEYLKSIPGPLRESLREAVYQALSSTPRMAISFGWAPSLVWAVTASTAADAGLLVLVLQGPNPPEAGDAQAG